MAITLKRPSPAQTALASVAASPQTDEALASELGLPSDHNAPTDVTDIPEEGQTTSVVRIPRNDHPTPIYASEGGSEGDWNQTDVKHPALKIVAAVGEAASRYTPGTVLLGDEVLFESVGPKGVPPKLTFIPIRNKKRYQEALSQADRDAGGVPQTADTAEEVENLGGCLRYLGKTAPSWKPYATLLMLIQAPEGTQHPAFSVELDGKLYCPAIYFAANSAFIRTSKKLFNEGMSLMETIGTLPSGKPIRRTVLHKKIWTFSPIFNKAGEHWIWSPQISMTNVLTPPAVREFIDELTGKTADLPAE